MSKDSEHTFSKCHFQNLLSPKKTPDKKPTKLFRSQIPKSITLRTSLSNSCPSTSPPPYPLGNLFFFFFFGNRVIFKGPETRGDIWQEMSERLMQQESDQVRAKQVERLRYTFFKFIFVTSYCFYHSSWTSLLRLLMLGIFLERTYFLD